jgi:hypothetical protein
MDTLICASDSINKLAIKYCIKNNLQLLKFSNKVPIDQKYAHMFDWARKVIVLNRLNNQEETYLFLGKCGKFGGYCATDVRKIS